MHFVPRLALRVVAATRAAALLAAIGTLLAACDRSASDAELTRWLDEARRENDQRGARAQRDEAASWLLSVRGSVRGGAVDFTASELAKMATTHVKTANPNHTSDVGEILDYRGVTVAAILDAAGAYERDGPGASDVTVVADDGFLVAQPIAEVRKFPVLFALEENGKPLTRHTGGPILQVFPHTTHPESRTLYPEGGAFYVTHLIVGTEPLALRVGARTFAAEDIAPLEEHVIEGKAGFRFRWPNVPVKIHGVLVRDLLKAANVALRPEDEVRFRRKPRTETKEREVTVVLGEDVLACDVLIGLRYKDARALIPATLGGPSVLAFSASCPSRSRGQAWPMFVESIEVVPADDGGAR